MIIRNLLSALTLIFAVVFGTISIAALADIEVEVRGDKVRSTTKQVSAVITAINAESRRITLEGALGNSITLTAGPEVTRLDEFSVGDLVHAVYASSISGELRAPTEAELAVPLIVLDGEAIAAENMEPGAVAGRTIRAVCTIEGMNRIARTVMLKGPDGDILIIDDVDPANLEGVSLGDPVIVTYTEAIALTLEKHTPAE
jgi:hypothetical protein